MKLYLNATSPYARLVRVVALEKGLQPELVWVDPWVNDPVLLAVNPALRIPALLTDAGICLSESLLIALHLDQQADPGSLLPDAKRDEVLQLAGIGQGLMDAAFGTVINRKFQGTGVDDTPLGQRRLAAMQQSLARLDTLVDGLTAVSLGSLVVTVALDYLSFRLPELDWQQRYPALAAQQQTLLQRPSLQATVFQ